MNNFILKNENAIYYECGFSCDNVIFLSLGSEKFFITDARYTVEAKQCIKNAEVIESSDLIRTARRLLKKSKIKKIHIDPYDFCIGEHEKLVKDSVVKFIDKTNFSKNKRVIKSDEEIELLAIASQLGRDGFDRLAKHISSETFFTCEKRFHFKTKEFLSNVGEFELSFDPIVAINENAAKPHALPSDKKLQESDLLLVDAGVKYNRYCSDRTATSCFKKGKIDFKREQKFVKKKQQKIYDIVYKAQRRAIEKARSGMKASQIDALARDVIENAGYGNYFVHSTGHGVGLDIHEFPVISKKNDIIIKDNMVFTIEPGIYLPGKFGVRIEDTVVMRNGKAIVL